MPHEMMYLTSVQLHDREKNTRLPLFGGWAEAERQVRKLIETNAENMLGDDEYVRHLCGLSAGTERYVLQYMGRTDNGNTFLIHDEAGQLFVWFMQGEVDIEAADTETQQQMVVDTVPSLIITVSGVTVMRAETHPHAEFLKESKARWGEQLRDTP